MVKLTGIFSRLSSQKVMVVGDFMLDTYTTGKINRISPEAPVSVLHVQKEESRPGGAGNVTVYRVRSQLGRSSLYEEAVKQPK